MSIEFKNNAVCYAGGEQWDADNNLSDALNLSDFQLNEPRQGDYLTKSELDTEQKYNDAVDVFGLFGFKFNCYTDEDYLSLSGNERLVCCNDGLWQAAKGGSSKRKITYQQLMAIGKLKRLINKRKSTPVSKVNRDIERLVDGTTNAELGEPKNSELPNSSELKEGNKYRRTIYGLCGTPVEVNVYRVSDAFPTGSAAIDHAVKKMLCAGLRGHKDKLTDIDNAIESLQAARLLLIQKGEV